MKTSIVDPSEYQLNILGVTVEGFSKGNFISISRNDPLFSQKRSLKGKTQVRQNKVSHYTLTFTLDSSVMSNTWLHTIYQLQEAYGIAFPVPVLFKDNLGGTTFFCKSAYLQEPETTLGTSLTTREWTLVCNNTSSVIGGNQYDDKLSAILTTISSAIGIMGTFGIDTNQFVNATLDSVSHLYLSGKNALVERGYI